MKAKTKTVITLGLATALLATSACTKLRPFKDVPKHEILDKSVVNTNDVFLYQYSTSETTRTTELERPFFMGDAKLVKLRFTEKSLDVLEVEPDPRFAANPQNNKLVLSIPVEHHAYKCRENAVGDCSNEEEENEQLSWNQKDKFRPDLKSMGVSEVSYSPLQIMNWLMGCSNEVNANVLSDDITSDAINIRIERSFRVGLLCLDDIESLSDATFSVVSHYSFVKLDTVASKDYKPVAYPEEDQGVFGFFTTEFPTLSSDNRDRVEGQTALLNRWNPEKKEIVYYLSEGFAKPENAAVRRSTFEGIAAINDGLKKAGSSIYLTLKDAEGRQPGDIRNNMIVMVEDPVAAGLLGYGPSVANPLTGEIVNARTVMYLGTVKKTIRNTYEELRKGLAEKQAAAEAEAQNPAEEESSAPPSGKGAGFNVSPDLAVLSLSSALEQVLKPQGASNSQFGGRTLTTAELREAAEMISKYRRNAMPRPSLLKTAKEKLEDKSDADFFSMPFGQRRELSKSSIQEKNEGVEAALKTCTYMVDDFNFSDTIAKAVRNQLGNPQELTPWEDLTEAERQKVMDVLVPYVWKPILIHEVGHNLGLRHNFQGSEDKANHYTKDELEKMGINHEIPYSTVMEYAAQSLNDLHTMGKYDIAALRFGYQRKVEKADKDNSLIDVPSTLEDLVGKSENLELKEYGYCTDEHVSLNAGCKRFDEGSSLKEIAQFEIKNYEDRYQWLNFRNGARSFSTFGDAAYADRIDSVFYNLRLFLEVRDRINARFNPTEKQWQEIPFLKDLDEAVALSAKFFLKVIATPDVHCIAAPSAGPESGAGLQVVPLAELTDAISCFDAELSIRLLKVGYKVLAQTGKSFQSRKAPSNKNPYADQIDVRGIWIDKILAANYLLTRTLGVGSLDETTGNYLSYKDTASELAKLVASILNKQVTGDVDLVFEDGSTKSVEMTYSLDLGSAQTIPVKTRTMRRLLGLPTEDTLLSKQLIRAMALELPHLMHNLEARPLIDAFSVMTSIPNDGGSSKDIRAVKIGSGTYLARPENLMARILMDDLEVVRLLSRIDEARLQAILKEMKAKPAPGKKAAPVKQTPEEKAVRKLKPAIIEKFLAGGFESEAYYSLIIDQVLAKK